MKKVLIWLLSLSLLFSLTGCSGNADADSLQEASSQAQNAPEESGSQNTPAQESAPEESVVSIEADTVVCALGFRPKWQIADELCSMVDESYIIGDSRNVGQIYHAISQGYYTALQI